MTLNQLAYDILNTEGFVHDDSFRTKMAVIFNLQLAIDRLKRQRLEKDLRMSGSRGTTDMMTTFTAVPVNYEASLNDRGYFTLPGQVYDIKQNGGIDYIVYNRESGCEDNLVGKHFTLTTPSEVDILDGSAFQKPRPAMPYYYRGRYNDGSNVFADRVWLIGINPQITSVEVGLYLTVGDLLTTDPDADLDLPADMALLVKYQVLNLERWCFSVPQENLLNDGRNTRVGAPQGSPPQTASVNSPLLDPEA